MDKVRQLAVLALVGVVAVLGAGWFLLVSPQRGKVADLNDQADQARSQTSTLQVQLARLRAEAKDLPKARAELAAVAAQLPPNPALPDLVHQLTKAAATAQVDLQVISPQPPQPVTTTAPSGAATLPAGGSAPQQGALNEIPISLTVAGTYFQLEAFEHALENLPRAYVVSGLDLKPGNALAKPTGGGTGAGGSGGTGYNGALTATITGSVFELTTTAPTTSTTMSPAAPSPSGQAPAGQGTSGQAAAGN